MTFGRFQCPGTSVTGRFRAAPVWDSGHIREPGRNWKLLSSTLSTWPENKSFGDKDASNPDYSVELSGRDQRKGEEKHEEAWVRLAVGWGQRHGGNVGVHVTQFKVRWLLLGSGKDVIMKMRHIYKGTRRTCSSRQDTGPARVHFQICLMPQKKQVRCDPGMGPRFPNSYHICS